MFSLDDIFDFVLRNLWLVLGLLGFAVRLYSQYVENAKKAELENRSKVETAQRQERANSFEGYLERTTATNLDDGRDDFSQTGQHNGPRPGTQQSSQQTNQRDTRGFEDLARDLQQARNQQTAPNDPQAQLRRLLAEKMGRAPTNPRPEPTTPPMIGRAPTPATQKAKTSNQSFDPDRTAASTFKPSSVTGPTSLEQNRVIEASFERSLNKGNLEPRTLETTAKTRTISGTTFSSQDAVRAVIWSEVLGTPKSRRR
jgi:hypothetical protein